MPVTFAVDPSKQPISLDVSAFLEARSKITIDTYMRQACPEQTENCKEILQDSFKSDLGRMFTTGDMGRGAGLVDVAVQAYSSHYHLVIRPDDVWIAILSQLSFYINAHAEELRQTFVSHEGKKTLTVTAVGSRYTVDFGHMAQEMTALLNENVKDPEICKWIMADFSTTTDVDRTIYAIEMMATFQKYFTYMFELTCGLPGVTLEGTKEDWENILSRIDKIEEFGEEPKAFARMLRAVLTRFVRSFALFSKSAEITSRKEDSEKKELREWWNRIAHHQGGGSGPTYLSGWITAFCPWNTEGKWIDGRCAPQTASDSKHATSASSRNTPSKERSRFSLLKYLVKPKQANSNRERPAIVLDGDVVFPTIDSDNIPSGFVSVDVILNDNGKIFQTVMIAGHLGAMLADNQKGEVGGIGQKAEQGRLSARVGVAAGWLMFVK